MFREFFSRSAGFVVAAGLIFAIVWAIVTLGPIAIERWF